MPPVVQIMAESGPENRELKEDCAENIHCIHSLNPSDGSTSILHTHKKKNKASESGLTGSALLRAFTVLCDVYNSAELSHMFEKL